MIYIYRIFLLKLIPSLFPVTLDSMNILPSAWDDIFVNSTDLPYLYDILVVAQLGYFHWNVTSVIENNNKLDGIMNPITHNKMRPKPCLIFSHYILFFFVPGTKTLACFNISSFVHALLAHLPTKPTSCLSAQSKLGRRNGLSFCSHHLSFSFLSVSFPYQLYPSQHIVSLFDSLMTAQASPCLLPLLPVVSS